MAEFTISPVLLFSASFLVLTVALIVVFLSNKKAKQYVQDLFPQKTGTKKLSRIMQAIIWILTLLALIFVVILLINLS